MATRARTVSDFRFKSDGPARDELAARPVEARLGSTLDGGGDASPGLLGRNWSWIDPGWGRKFGRRFARRGVDLVLQGHDHVYSRARKRGVTYIVTRGGGASLYGCQDPLPKPVKTCAARHHFLDLRATQTSLSVTAVVDDGTVLEEVDVASND